MPSQVIYSPSGRKVTLLIAFLLILSWICFKQSNTYDETAHRLALCGSGLFVLFAVLFLIQFLRGLPTFTLTELGFFFEHRPVQRPSPHWRFTTLRLVIHLAHLSPLNSSARARVGRRNSEREWRAAHAIMREAKRMAGTL